MTIANEDYVDCGIVGTVRWFLEYRGTLILIPENGDSGVLPDFRKKEDIPWHGYKHHIRRAIAKKKIVLSEYADYLFSGCTYLSFMDLSDFDTSRVKSFKRAFYECNSLETLTGISLWDVSDVRDFSEMFMRCTRLKNVDALSRWNIKSAVFLDKMFYGCKSLCSLKGLHNWNTGNVTNMFATFMNCKSLVSMNDLKSWNVGKVGKIDAFIKDCPNIKVMSAIPDWNFRSVPNYSVQMLFEF